MLQRDGTVQDPTVESGDRPFCAQVMSALKKANIPPAPDEKNLSNLQSCRAGREALSLPAEMAPAITEGHFEQDKLTALLNRRFLAISEE